MEVNNKKIVLSDSKSALNELLKVQPLLLNADILSSSPTLLNSAKHKTLSLFNKCDRETFQKQRELTKSTINKVYSHFYNAPHTGLAISCASRALEASKVYSKLYALSQFGERKKYIITKYTDNKTKSSEVLNFPWENYLPKEKVENFAFNEEVPYEFKHDEIGFLNRLKKAGVKNVAYRIFIKIFKKLPFLFSQKKILIYKENDLLMESAVEMVLKGYSLHYIKPKKKEALREIPFSVTKEEVEPLIKEWTDLLLPEMRVKFSDYFYSLIIEDIEAFFNFKESWEESLKSFAPHTIKGVFTNSPNRVDSRSLFSTLNEFKVPLIAFQHGVTREISKYHDLIEVNFEGNASHFFITFNKEARRISKNSSYSIAKTFIAGTSERFKNINTKSNLDIKPFVFVSTNLPVGNTGFFMSDYDDYNYALEELNLVKKVFSNVNKSIDFKPYLFDNRRYPDEDFLISDIAKGKVENVRLLKKKIDMRYLLNEYEVIITTKATSTVSWPILGNRPTVFLNFGHASPLRNEVIEDFSKGIFLFGIKEEADYDSVVEFLNLPIKEIKKQWEKKSEARATLIKKYFSEDLDHGAKKAAQYLSKELSSPTHS